MMMVKTQTLGVLLFIRDLDLSEESCTYYHQFYFGEGVFFIP